MKNHISLLFTGCLILFSVMSCNKDGVLDHPINDGIDEFIDNEKASGSRKCAADDVYQHMLATDPSFQLNREQIERFTREFQSSKQADIRALKTIPVVVHVVWKTTAQNISESQIQSQIDVLNEDFRRLNADKVNTPSAFLPMAADAEIEFCLAQQDPNGNATNGIVRRQTTINAFGTNDAVKFYNQGGSNAWDASQYLNIWVCNMSGGILGYAQFPGGNSSTDGVVITHTAFGTMGTAQAPFDKGRTATHEVGHWLNLFHIWGDDGNSCSGSDYVSDTPNQGPENYSCPSFPKISCNNGPNGAMFMNYMDYTDDACMNIYTLGQKTRMNALFAVGGARYGLLNSVGCSPPGGGGGCGIPGSLNTTNITSSSATVSWSAVNNATSYILQFKLSNAQNWTTVNNITSTSHNLTGLLANASYVFKVQAVCGQQAGSYSPTSTFMTLQEVGNECSDIYEPNNTSGSAKPIGANSTITAKIGTTTDKDWYQFNNSSSQKNIRISLTNLPEDYDVYLYRGNTLVDWSENWDTEDEEIIYNTSRVATYKIKVVGYDGAYNNSACYNLTTQISASPLKLQKQVIPSGKYQGKK